MVDWLRIGRVARAAAAISGDLRGQAMAHIGLALAYHSQGRYRRAISSYRTALELSTEAGWEEGRATALSGLGHPERTPYPAGPCGPADRTEGPTGRGPAGRNGRGVP